MPISYIAQQNTSWSAATWTNTAYWKAGDGSSITGAPTLSDDVYANNKTVTLDTATSAGNLFTTAFTGSVNSAVSGGTFSKTVTGVHTGNATAGGGTAITMNASGISLTVNGNVTGSSTTSYIVGIYIPTAINNVTIIVNGTISGGPANYAYGITSQNNAGGTASITATTAQGGFAGASHAIYNPFAGMWTVNVTNAYGTLGSSNGCGIVVEQAGGGSITVTNAYGGNAANAHGVFTSVNGCSITVTNAYGGTSANANGVRNAATANAVYVTNAYGSQSTYGVHSTTTGLTVVNTAVAFPPPPASYVAGTLPSWISAVLSSSTPGYNGVYNASTGPCYIQRGYFGLFGMAPTYGNVKFGSVTGTYASHTVSFVSPVIEVAEAASNVWATAGTMYDLVETTNQNLAPVPANVRSGVLYGAAGAYTGTMVVPAASNVVLNALVDNTVGTGIITPATLRPYLLTVR